MSNKITCCTREMTHDAINIQARRAATGFAETALVPDRPVAIMLRNDFAFFTATLGASLLGAVATTINWHFTADEVAYILTDSNAGILVVHADIWRKIGAKLAPDVIEALTVLVVPTALDIAGECGISEAECAVPQGATDWHDWLNSLSPWRGTPAKPQGSMIYTSGTTGHPKGVRRLGPVEVTTRGNHNAFAEGARHLLSAPMYHAAPNRIAMSVFQTGGSLILLPRFDAEQTLQLIEQQQITHAFMVPIMFIRMLKLPQEIRARYDVSSLQHVAHTGAPCPPEVKRAMIEWWGEVIFEYYGGTETGAVTYCTSQESLAHPGTVGRAVPDASIRIYDENGNECPAGTAGEIYCRLHSYPDFTYHGRDEERQAIEKDGLFTCGDIGYLDEQGYLYISDRKKDMVISGGVNIYPAQVEAGIFGHEDISDCVVFGIPDSEYGEVLAAAVQPRPGVSLDVEQLKVFLRERIAGYMVPREVYLYEALPRDDSGKISKKKLRDFYWEKSGRTI